MTLHEQAADAIKMIASLDVIPGQDDPLWAEIRDLAKRLSKKAPPPTADEKAAIDEMRKFYREELRGTVDGLTQTTKLLIKHRDWREVLPTIIENLCRQVKERKAMAEAGKHVSEWPMLATYINQRRWESVYYDIPPDDSNLPIWYTGWLRKTISSRLPWNDVVARALTSEQIDMFAQFKGPFVGLDRTFSPDTRKEMFAQAHVLYYSDGRLMARYGKIIEYMKVFIQAKKEERL